MFFRILRLQDPESKATPVVLTTSPINGNAHYLAQLDISAIVDTTLVLSPGTATWRWLRPPQISTGIRDPDLSGGFWCGSGGVPAQERIRHCQTRASRRTS